MKNLGLSRSLKDIQMQCDRLLNQKGSLVEIQTLMSFSHEVKSHLESLNLDDFIKEQIAKIPDTKKFVKKENDVTETVLFAIRPISHLINKSSQKKKFKPVLKNLKKAYANVEYFMKTSGEI